VLKATGLPVRVIRDMGALSWEEQVAAMANTGILVAVHGAALTNVIFMPANAVLIEVRARRALRGYRTTHGAGAAACLALA
jgi:capsular polysaccharide biosynthesis protein